MLIKTSTPMHMLDSISTAINWRWDFDCIIQRSWIALSSVIICQLCCIARKLLLPMSESTIQDLARLMYAPKVFMKLHQKVLLYTIHGGYTNKPRLYIFTQLRFLTQSQKVRFSAHTSDSVNNHSSPIQ
jgi:hypothetical protein